LVDTKKRDIPINFNFIDGNRPENKQLTGKVQWVIPRGNEIIATAPGSTTGTFPVRQTRVDLKPERSNDGFKGSLHVSADINSFDEFDRQGILLKRGDSFFKTWSQRYFLIKDNYLFWFKLKGTNPRGFIDISETTAEKAPSPKEGIYPILITKKKDSEPVIVAALSEQDRDDWIKFFSKAALIKRAVEQKPMLEPPTRRYSIFNMLGKDKPDVHKTLVTKIKEGKEEEEDEKEEVDKAGHKIEVQPAIFNTPGEPVVPAPVAEEPKKDAMAQTPAAEPKKDEPVVQAPAPVAEEPKKEEPAASTPAVEPKKEEPAPVVAPTAEEPKKEESVPTPATDGS